MWKKSFALFLFLIVYSFNLFASCPDGYVDRGSGCVPGWFVDEKLGEAIVEVVKNNGYFVIDETDLTHTMMEEIAHLDISGMQVFSLDGIENLSNLKSLDASGNLFTDIESISDLFYLETLNLSFNDIQDIDPLNDLNQIVVLDISNTNVFDFTTIYNLNNIALLIVGNEDMTADVLFRDSTVLVADFVENNNLDACWKTDLIHEKPVFDGQSVYVGGFQTRRTMTDCGSHGTCTYGQCDCDSGYALVNGYCYATSSSSCVAGEAFEPITNDHLSVGDEIEICFETNREFFCGDYLTDDSKEPYPVTANYSSSYYDFGTKTRTQCYYGDTTCNTSSYCLFKCADGYSVTADKKNCVADVAYREIGPDSKKNLVFPKIVRKDVALESIPGVPSFVPTYSFKWMEDGKGNQRGYWSVDIPNLQMHYKNGASGVGGVVFLLKHNFYKVTVSMPWGIEEYSLVDNKGCFDAYSNSCDCDSPNFSYEKWHVFPSPGQKNHNFIELFRRGQSPYWTAFRHGEDGSETKFDLGHTIDRYYHDPFPITYYKTRDGKQVYFDYTRNSTNSNIIESVEITDPANRVIKIEADSSGLNGGLFLYDHISDFGKNNPETIEVYVNQNLIVTYDNGSSGFDMTATINGLRKDTYVDESDVNGKKYRYRARDLDGDYLGPETYITKIAKGYRTEQFVVEEDGEIPKWIIKEETLNKWPIIYNCRPWEWDKYYKTIYSSDLSYLGTVKTTLYGEMINGIDSFARKVEENYSPWLQPIQKTVCKTDFTGVCEYRHTSTEKFGYNINGALVFHRDGNYDTEMVLYNHYDITADNYILTYKYGTNAEKAKLKKAGKPFYKTKYPRDIDELSLIALYTESVTDNISSMANWSTNDSFRRRTSYSYTEEDELTVSLMDVWDLKTVVTPDGLETEYLLDYEVLGSTDFGKVIRKTVGDGVLIDPVCYSYDTNGMLEKQGVWNGSSCDYKKEFSFITNSVFMKSDNMIQNSSPVLYNKYYYDTLGRKVADENSAGIVTIYHYDYYNRVRQTDFGCTPDSTIDENQLYAPENYGFTFPFGSFTCEYSRYYYYDEMSNLYITIFEEEYFVTDTPSITTNSGNDLMKIAQLTEYDFVGRPIINCQFDDVFDNDHDQLRCIETKHDAFGNIVEKTEKNSTRIITYDHLDRPLAVTVDGLQIEESSYSTNTEYDGTYIYYGYDIIENKYGAQTIICYDNWGRKKRVDDPFSSYTYYVYNNTNYINLVTSQLNYDSNDQKIGETSWTYDNLGRKEVETKEQFVPGDEANTAVYHSTYWAYDSVGNIEEEIKYSGTSPDIVYSSGIGYTYDEDLNVLLKTSNYEYINSNWVEKSSVENEYVIDSNNRNNGRLFKKKFNSNDQTIIEEYDFDDLGRITETCTTDNTGNNTRCRYKLYNTGGNVIYESDEEADTTYAGIWIGNEKYYIYNDFGDIEKTVCVMTDDGKGLGSDDLNPWLDDSMIRTTYDYDSYGRLISRKNDRQGETTYTYYSDNTSSSYRKNKLYSMQTTPATNNGYNTNDTYTDSGSTNQKYEYGYDEYGDEEEIVYKDDDTTELTVTFTRDSYGRVTGKSTDGENPVTQTFSYSDNGVDRNQLVSASDNLKYTYYTNSCTDDNDCSTQYGYACVSSVCTKLINHSTRTITRSYDSFGMVYSETFPLSKTVSRRNLDSKTYQLTYPNGKVIEREYSDGKLDEIRYGSSSSPSTVAAYSRTEGVLTSVVKGNTAFTETFTYNDWNKLSQHIANDGSANIYNMSYDYSRAWHLTEKSNGLTSKSDQYSYDSYYRLKEVKYDVENNSPARTDTFALDGVHNLEYSTEDSETYDYSHTYAWGVDKMNRIRENKVDDETTASITYTYDKRNNMIFEDNSGTSDDRTYVYDDLNRLIWIKDENGSIITSYTYDVFNRRIRKQDRRGHDPVEFNYTYDDWNIVEIRRQYDDQITITNVIDAGMDDHVAVDIKYSESGQELWTAFYYFITDERGNVVALTDTSGNVLERYRYRSYGEHEVQNSCHTACETTYSSCFAGCNENQTCEDNCLVTKNSCDTSCASTDYVGNKHDFLWGGSLHEPISDLYWMRNRYYHKDMHRFINQDPIGIWGDANNLGNGFAYVAGMVVEASDPTGLEWQPGTNATNPISDPSDLISDGFTRMYDDPNWQDAYFGENENNINDRKATGSEEQFDPETGHSHHRTDYDNGDFEYFEIDENGDAIRSVIGNTKTGNFVEYSRNEDGQLEANVYKNGKLQATYFWVTDEDGKNGHWEKVPVEEMPVDDEMDMMQTFFANQLLKKMLAPRDKKTKEEMLSEEGPVIKFDNNGRKTFIFNPYYKGKDPMKEEIWRVKNADGTWGFVRNPFAPSGATSWSNTFEMFQQKGFFQPEVDPYWQ